MFAAIAAAIALPMDQRGSAFDKIGPYRSRGHGRGGPEPRHGSARSKYQPHQGARECERRRVGGFAFQRRMQKYAVA